MFAVYRKSVMCTVNGQQKKPKKKLDTTDRLGKALLLMGAAM